MRSSTSNTNGARPARARGATNCSALDARPSAAPLRGELRARRLPDAKTLAKGRDGQRLEYVGVVICRQQPGTASGRDVHDARGRDRVRQLVVWAQVFARVRAVIKMTSLIGVTGRLQVQEGIVHLIAEYVWVPRLSRPVAEVDSLRLP